MRWSFGSGLLTCWCIYTWTVWQYFFISERELTTTGETATECTTSARRSTILVAIIGVGPGMGRLHVKCNRLRLRALQGFTIAITITITAILDVIDYNCDYIGM